VLGAADLLAADGTQTEVLDLRWLRPLDEAAIADAVTAGRGRVIVVHEATATGGFGAEVAARVTERHFAALAAPVLRVCTPDVRIPSAPALQQALLPTASSIAQAAKEFLAGLGG
jgi:2-oxoisovalerate dehydrogenase E1 component